MWSHLHSFPRSHRGPRRNVFEFGYVFFLFGELLRQRATQVRQTRTKPQHTHTHEARGQGMSEPQPPVEAPHPRRPATHSRHRAGSARGVRSHQDLCRQVGGRTPAQRAARKHEAQHVVASGRAATRARHKVASSSGDASAKRDTWSQAGGRQRKRDT